MFPVPLNSWKITSSMREPVSMSAVARMVRLPEPSQLRAAPKNWRGNWSARLSTPPDIVRPPGPISRFDARPSRVSESSRITTWRPASTSRLARSMASRDRRMCESELESEVEASTSAGTTRRKCVTSSGRSSTSSRMRCTSGWRCTIALPRCSSSVVLPAFGGETMSPRWPLPDGGDDVDDAQADLGALARELERLARVDRNEVLEVGERLVLLGLHSARLRDFYENAATVTTIAGEAFDLRPVAQAAVPCNHVRDHDVVALR